ncbi:alpha-tectorin [Kryptolebias marmoratus]|uniref:alpha-tectorin n=1 Tax=Kryptolebias marmoratus TaxID=37003 RepID=UPI0018AC9F81|nr:alpha-tectorin [Kryptolebias marmoratus]
MEKKLLLPVLLLWMISGVSLQGIGPLYNIVGNISSRSDDGSSPQIPLLHSFVYFGQPYTQIFVNHNGHLTFQTPWSSYIPQRFPMNGTRDIIAPFWTDLNNEVNGDIYYAQFTSGNFIQQVTQDINEYFPELDFSAKWIFMATWYKVGYFSNPGAQTTFQAVLTTDGQYSFVLFNYGDLVPSSRSIQAGYDTINSTEYFILPGSFSSNAAGNNSVFRHNSNVNEPGRWAFRVDHEPTGPLYEIVGNTSSHSDDGSSPQILLLHPFVFFGRTHSQIYVNHNGHLTFEAPWSSYIPQRFPMNGTRDIIAAFWTDLNNAVNGDIYYAQFTSGHLLQQVTQDINEYFPQLEFSAKWIFIATWYGVAYFSNPGSRTTFQAVLTTDGKFSFLLMNYGYLDPTSSPVQAGYDTISSTEYFILPGSFSSNASGSNSVFSHNSNVNEPGRWVFRVDQSPSGPLYPISGNTTQRALNGSSPQIILQQPFVYFGTSYNQIFVNHNGHITFTGPWSLYAPERIPLHGSRDFIAPFWTYFDNRVNGLVYYNQFTSGSILQQATQDINKYFPEFNFTASWVFVATWNEMAYYPNTGTETTVQAVLISGGQYSFVLMNYGKIAPTVWKVQVGYDTVNSTYYLDLSGSFTSNASGISSVFRLNSNVNVPGRWAFRVDHGAPEPLYEIVGTTSSRSDDGSSPQIQLLNSFVYFGQPYTQIYVNHNGHLTFKAPWFSYITQRFPMNGTRDIIAPFWTHLSNAVTGDIYYGQYTSGRLLYQVTQDINEYFPGLNFHAKLIFIATWDRVAYFSKPGTATFQAVLTTDGQYSFVLMNYGYLAPTTRSIQAGYDTVNSPFYFSIPGSFSSTATGSNSVFSHNSNVNVPGRWAFRVDHVSTGPLYEIAGTTSSHSDDGSSPQIQLLQPFDYFGQSYTQIYVNHNGHLTFQAPWFSYIPQRFPMRGTRDIIAPFWTDLNNVVSGDIYYAQHTSGQLLHQVTRDINEYFPELNFNAELVFIATWDEVAYYSGPGTATFQAVLTTDGQYSFLLMNYGYLAPTTKSIQAGYDTVNSHHYFTIPGSFSGSSSVFSQNSNVNKPGRWVFRVDLGCTLNDGSYYKVGESFLADSCSQRCECQGLNDLHCTPASCGPAQECSTVDGQLGCYNISTCTVMGDPHYITYDGALAHFQGTCSYVITENVGNNNNETQFSVVATNSHRGNNHVSFVSSVDIYLSNQSDNVHVRIGPNIRVKVNGVEESLPTSAGSFGQVTRQGSYIVFDAVDFIVQFDGRSILLVRMGQHYQNRVTGMCGNFNGDPTDDKVLPNGTLAQNDNHFGHGWKSNTSQAGCGSTDEECDGLSDCQFIEEYTELCRVITNTSGPFSSCHLHSNPQPFFTSCVYDLCLYTPANGMLCSVVSAYEKTCSVLGLNVTDWRSSLLCDEADPCEELDCEEHEWCGQKDGVYGCFCDEHHQRLNDENFDFDITCLSSSGTISLSRCQVFEAGFHSDALHLNDDSCNGTIQDGRLVFHFDSDDHLCGTVLQSNGTHFMYQNAILSDVVTNGSLIRRRRPIHLRFSCVYPLTQAASMTVEIRAVESHIIKRLPSGRSLYEVRMIPYQDADFLFPLTNCTIELKLDQRLYVEIRTEGLDQNHISTVLDSCWATPDDNASNPVRWDLIISKCPNPADDTVEIIQNGVSTVTRFSFRMFTFRNSEEIHLHCSIRLCLLANNNCTVQCHPNLNNARVQRDVSYHDSTDLSMGPLHLNVIPTQVVASGPLYPISGIASSQSDDGSSPRLTLQRPFVYFGRTYNNIYVNHNGHLTFNNALSAHTPQRFPLHGGKDLIAPFWTDLDNRQTGKVLYNQYTSGSVLQQATRDINTYFPSINFNANWVFVATWNEVAYYPNSGTKTTVQAVLISGGQYSFVLMNYGIIASTNRNVQAGYDTINSDHYVSIPGSFSSAATGSNSNFRLSSNVNVPGRWAFKTDSGARGCTFNGEPVQLGDSFWSDSTCAQKCICTAAGLQCHSQPCSFSQICQPSSFQFSCQTVQRGTCTISGDPHYYTFDNKVFHFQGTCTYVLSEQCQHGLPYYRVEGKNEHRGSTRVSWTRLVKVFVYNETIELVKGHPGKAKVNGNFASTPFYLHNGTVQVYESGFSVIVSTDFGLTVSYDTNHYVQIGLPYTYQNATCGLCGNFNNHPGDDFITREGEVVSSDVVFANSWQASGDDDPDCEPQCGGLDCPACTEAQTALYSNSAHCGILHDSAGPFAACHQLLPPLAFVESCVYDLCVGEGYQPILCQALSVYASQCQQNGIQLPNWRRPGFCEIPCPANSHFEAQGTGCPATCVNPNSTQNCPLPDQESCICNLGYVLSGGVCVLQAECGCSFEGRYYRSGETVILDEDCGRQCRCRSGSMTCSPHSCGPHETCRVEDGERGCRPNSYATCWIRGSGSYQTFDGLTYQYPGACRLTLAKVMGLYDQPHFMVTAEKVPRGQQGFISLLKIEAGGSLVTIEMGSSSTVQVDGQLIRLPYSSGSNQIRIYHSNIHSVILRTTFGLTVQTVWPHFVRVTVPAVYSSSLGGLCGNYNGDPHDDFRTPSGILVNSSQVFGDSWRDGSLAAHCEENFNHNLTNNYNSSEFCGILSSENGPFTPCWAAVDPEQQVNVCVDILQSSRDPTSTLCEVLRDYVLMCQQKGVSPRQWRNSAGCTQTCPSNSHYELCGTSCPFTCPSLSFPFTCNTQCQEGCQCNNGFVLNGNQCVPPTSCGCYHQGHYRQDGEQFWDGEECQSFCTCNGTTGAVQCFPSSCGPQQSCRVVGGEFGCHLNPHGTCSASGDPHYITFDRKAFDFQGTCRYVLATVCNDTDELHHFSVEAKNEPWNGLTVSIVAEVFVNVWNYQVHISRERPGVVQVNGVTHNLPIALNEGQMSVYASGPRIFVSVHFGLSVTYNGHSTVFIAVPPNYSGKVCGLCGNFNGNPNDDFHTPSGTTVTSPDVFGTSWKVPGNYSCSDGCGSSCPQCTDDQAARAQCEVIQAADGPFSFCHEEVDPAPYFSDCVFDVCVSGNQGHDLLCRALESYVSACQSANVRIYPWRQNTTCKLDCPATSHYELCGTDCGHTCASNTDATCEQVCSEGCFCDDGFVRSGTRCVSVESCGCQFDGFYFTAGESFWTDSCSQRCECYGPNDLRCTPASCTPAQECTIRNGQLGCYDTMATCTVMGDPHYITYDGALANFQGTCSYIITESVENNNNETQFSVVATNSHRGNNRVSFVTSVDIYLSKQSENVHVRIGPNIRVKVNGAEESLPTFAGSFGQVMRQGSYIVFDADDFKVQLDGRSTLLVRMGQHYQNRVTGMCGNFNGDPTDDKVLPNGTLAQNDNHFGNGWKSPTSQAGCGSTDEENDGLSDCRFIEEYTDLCSVITNTSGPFSSCHLHSNPQPFFTSCVYDLCLYTPANGMLCSVVSAYERTCSVLGLNIPDWRSALHCDEADPCEALDCAEHEWCGQKDGVYGCFCDEHHHRPNNESFDSSITCVSSSGTMSLSHCQLFEAGFPSSSLHLRDGSCNGTIQDGRLVFHFNNDDQLCGTVLRSNGTHFMYENVIQGDVDPHDGIISREKTIHLNFNCVYPLAQALSMDVGINPVESIVHRKLPSGEGHYHLRMIPFDDADYQIPLAREGNLEMEIDQMLYIEVQTEGVDEQQISTILYSCWATPFSDASYPVRWDLIKSECPNPEDGTVELIQNGVSTTARFSFKMFTFTNFSSVFLHCQVKLCLLRHNDCTAHCYLGQTRVARDVAHHDTAAITLGPLVLRPDEKMKQSSASSQWTSMMTLIIVNLVTAITLM